MQLNQYPRAIAKAESAVLAIQEQIAITVDQLACCDADIETAIATNSELKNDQQRKAARIEAQREPDYIFLKNELKEFKFQLAEKEIDLNQRRNEFSVAKLEVRLQIAEAEAVA